MQPNLTWKWIAATALGLVLAVFIFLPTRSAAQAASTLDNYYASSTYNADDPEVQASKPSPFPERRPARRARAVETPFPDNQ